MDFMSGLEYNTTILDSPNEDQETGVTVAYGHATFVNLVINLLAREQYHSKNFKLG